MPKNKDLKRLIRQRLAVTGERYTQAHLAITGVGEEGDQAAPLDRTEELRLSVQQLADKDLRGKAFVTLVGGMTATELKRVVDVPDDVLAALIEGLSDPHPRIRWWCVQILDHVPDERALWAVAPLLDDPVDRVRCNAAHALGCVGCKRTADPRLSDELMEKLAKVAQSDPSPKVRREAAKAYECRLEFR